MMCPSDILFIQTLSNNYEKKGEEDIQKKKSGAEDMYDFEAKLVTSADSKQIASVTGVVTMEESQSSWKISSLTLKASGS